MVSCEITGTKPAQVEVSKRGTSVLLAVRPLPLELSGTNHNQLTLRYYNVVSKRRTSVLKSPYHSLIFFMNFRVEPDDSAYAGRQGLTYSQTVVLLFPSSTVKASLSQSASLSREKTLNVSLFITQRWFPSLKLKLS